MSSGIDYGMGKTNVDHETGIRYGVISQHTVSEAWSNTSEAVYGDPTCPQCGGDVLSTFPTFPEDTEARGDYYCKYCEKGFDADECTGEDPIGWKYEGDGYVMTDCLDYAIIITQSKYYTLAQFCSPCVPGAGNLDSAAEDGVKTYCLGHDWFDGEKAPYPVFSVETDKEIKVEGAK